MKLSKKFTLKAAAFIPFVLVASAQANQITGTMEVTAVIGDGCQINNLDATGSNNDFGILNFGMHSSLEAFIDAQGGGTSGVGFEMNCTSDLDYTIGLGDGLHSDAGVRRMSDGGTNFIPYYLYQDSMRTTEWRDSGAGLYVATGSGMAQTHIVYGRIMPGTTPPAGTYSDTLQVVVSW